MLKLWLKTIDAVLEHKPGLHVAGKYIAHNLQLDYHTTDIKQDLTLDMLGFQKKKLTMLKDYYYHEESIRVALLQLQDRRNKGTYGSCGVTTYGHFAKKERPMHGPCIQSLVFTHFPNGTVDTNIYYRTTEVFKKFAADLIFLRDMMLPQFNVNGKLTFTFANATFHPMYWVVSAPYLKDPVRDLTSILVEDQMIWKGIVRWTHRFMEQPESLQKFKQGYRVSKHLHRLLDPAKLKALRDYVALHKPKEKIHEQPDDEDTEL